MRLTRLLIALISLSLLSVLEMNSRDKENTAGNFYFTNIDRLDSFFAKLYELEHDKNRKINIVHIGDSHIQADFLTDAIRQPLQQKFGNAGLGFSFPYNLARTNGSKAIKYTSSASWRTHPNIGAKKHHSVGLSGIGFYTESADFILNLKVTPQYAFTKMKIISSVDEIAFNLSHSQDMEDIVKKLPTSAVNKYHRIQRGENLSIIGQKHRVSVRQLQVANGLSNTSIQAGKTLKIPNQVNRVSFSQKKHEEQIQYLKQTKQAYHTIYTSDKPITDIMLMPNIDMPLQPYVLNGIVLENDQAGIIYHSIGVNGARYQDYNKYPLFFEQTSILKPDLIIVSMGTNESYSAHSIGEFLIEVKSFVTNIRRYNPAAVIILTTPPPSTLRRGMKNNYIESYTLGLKKQEIVSWDLFSHMDGYEGISRQGKYNRYIKRDGVHYTEQGYEIQGAMFFEDFISAYNNYKKRQKN